MNKNLQELTERIYREGIEKADEERSAMLDKAKTEARQIIADAEARAKAIVEQAQNQANELKLTNESEMRLASRQAISALKQRIADLIIADVVEGPLEQAVSDADFMKQILTKMIDHWLTAGADDDDVRILLPDSEREALREYFRAKGGEQLREGLKVEFSGVLKDGFMIGPSDGRYKISFTSEDFENYFKTFMRPRLIKLLYGEEV